MTGFGCGKGEVVIRAIFPRYHGEAALGGHPERHGPEGSESHQLLVPAELRADILHEADEHRETGGPLQRPAVLPRRKKSVLLQVNSSTVRCKIRG